MDTVLWIVIPCYNEEDVLPITSELFLKELSLLIEKEKISSKSRILFINDGSRDKTWEIIKNLAEKDEHYIGICQSRNRGHQNAVLAGLMEAKKYADITISIDCDGQDDITAMEAMINEYHNGCEIVYGVRSKRDTDTFFKRVTAEGFYKLLNTMGAEVVYNHADYRLVSRKVLEAFSEFKEVNLFLRGMFPLVGFKSTSVYYERQERMAVISWALGNTVSGWASMICVICFIGGVQLLCTGVIGQYIGKVYMETKHRPRYIISDRTYEKQNMDDK